MFSEDALQHVLHGFYSISYSVTKPNLELYCFQFMRFKMTKMFLVSFKCGNCVILYVN